MKINQTLFQVLGILILLFLFWLIKRLFGTSNNRFKEFFIDSQSNLYNLAKLQAFLWAFVIMAFIITNFLIIASAKCINLKITMQDFQINFPEQILWLLGLSLTSYITIKGITEKITVEDNSNQSTIRQNNFPTTNLSNLVSDKDEKFDFSKFQMMIWTFLALAIYLISCNNFYYKLMDPEREELASYLFLVSEDKSDFKRVKLNTYEFDKNNIAQRNLEIDNKIAILNIEIDSTNEANESEVDFIVEPQTTRISDLKKEKEINESEIVHIEKKVKFAQHMQDTSEIPTISTSLLILMGLSQGAFVANKLRMEKDEKNKDENSKFYQNDSKNKNNG